MNAIEMGNLASSNRIEFRRAYSKLRDPVFTSLRKYNAENLGRFFDHQGQSFQVFIEGNFEFTAKLLQAVRVNSASLSTSLVKYDCDGDLEFMKFMKDFFSDSQDYVLLLFQRNGEGGPTQ